MSQKKQTVAFQAPSTSELNHILSDYNVKSLEAQSKKGAVYLAQQISVSRKVVIRLLPKQHSQSQKFCDTFLSQAEKLTSVQHPHLKEVYDYGVIEGMLFVVTEHIKGNSLRDLIQIENLDHQSIAKLCSQISSSLSGIHDTGLLHLNIKPSNIFLNKKNKPKLGDYGLARINEETESKDLYSYSYYTAPEVLKNPEIVAVGADIYSIGILLYKLLTNQIPGKAYVPASEKVGAHEEFDNIIRKATHPAPKMRYKDAKTLAEDLDKLHKTLQKTNQSATSPNAQKFEQENKDLEPKTKVSQFNKTFFLYILLIFILLAACYTAWTTIKTQQLNQAEKLEIIKTQDSITTVETLKPPAGVSKRVDESAENDASNSLNQASEETDEVIDFAE